MTFRPPIELVILVALVLPAVIIIFSAPMRLFGLAAVDPVAFVFDMAFFVAVGWLLRASRR